MRNGMAFVELGVRLFLCGDVMAGRGVDQILPHPSESHLYEGFVNDANDYVRLAERHSGPMPQKRDFDYPWGDALSILDEWKPLVRIINLETSVTTSEDNWPRKGINYRMHPDNVPFLTSARIDCCVLANNHVLDWGHKGLAETVSVLRQVGIRTVGAGRNELEADAPAAIEIGQGRRVLVFAWGDDSSGVPSSWAAAGSRGGVNFLHDGISTKSAEEIARKIGKARRPSGDVVVLSLHWGGNWGYEISKTERDFAHQLIDSGTVDILYGHSSHHPKAIEVYKGKLILYGCGDFLNDYEGISGHNEFHDELTLMYFPVVDGKNGTIIRLDAVPMKINKMRLNHTNAEDSLWLYRTMARECAKFAFAFSNVHKCNGPTNFVTLVEEKTSNENGEGKANGGGEKLKMLVDCASAYEKEKLEKTLRAKGISTDGISHLVITHWHYDHCGNIGLFPNAQLITPERILAEGSERINADLPEFVSVNLLGGHSAPGDIVVKVQQIKKDQGDKCVPWVTSIVGDLFEFEYDWLSDQPWKQCSICPDRQLISRFLCWHGSDEIVPGHGPSFRISTEFPEKSFFALFGINSKFKAKAFGNSKVGISIVSELVSAVVLDAKQRKQQKISVYLVKGSGGETVLVNTGGPGQGQALVEALQSHEIAPVDVKYLVITNLGVHFCHNLHLFQSAKVFMSTDVAFPGSKYASLDKFFAISSDICIWRDMDPIRDEGTLSVLVRTANETQKNFTLIGTKVDAFILSFLDITKEDVEIAKVKQQTN
ncbi:hypothetical protein niasHT_023530 [Heterodera trifolii]|uniref:Capsule synthesis protein CapA domain-containing protein n=1 Tax=Heterodera trifolii TaxID=157864 RepID=A0ABD2K333_9BILA